MGSGKRGSDYILQKHEGIKSMEYIEIKACAMNLKIHFNKKMTTLRDFLDKVMELGTDGEIPAMVILAILLLRGGSILQEAGLEIFALMHVSAESVLT
jgi:hypothetical protein